MPAAADVTHVVEVAGRFDPRDDSYSSLMMYSTLLTLCKKTANRANSYRHP